MDKFETVLLFLILCVNIATMIVLLRRGKAEPEIYVAHPSSLNRGGYQPNKSDLNDNKPPQDTGASK